MSSNATVNSRLRVLVARAFRAEKLYGASAPNRPDKRLNYAQLAEAAGELRSKEWQKAYYQLRASLNDLLALGSPQATVDGVIALRLEFLKRTEEAAQFVEHASSELQDAAARQEFSHLFKLTLELIRQKAVAQSSRAVCDELGAVLKASGVSFGERRKGIEPSWLTAPYLSAVEDGEMEKEFPASKSFSASVGDRREAPKDDEAAAHKPANVVPLRRHSAFGKMKR